MMTVFLFLLVLGVLVFVHELGHFAVARRNGIKADEFGFGFPPRMVGAVWNDEKKRYRIIFGNREVQSAHTVYSLNWIPLGGFVKIKGENGEERDADSFAVQSPWVRIKVLAAGVVMNFLFAWFLIAAVITIGFPRSVGPDDPISGPRTIQISQVLPNTPAEAMGLRFGDVIVSVNKEAPTSVKQVQELIAARKGETITLTVTRGASKLSLQGVPRIDYPANEGSLGIGLGETEMAKYPWYESIWRGAVLTFDLMRSMLVGIGSLLAGLVSGDRAGLSDVAGPVGIAKLTGQVSELGFVYLLYFAAILSINLGIVNILPIPALDGGRILFILIEMLKGSPVSQKTEGIFHQVGFLLLITLMILITVHDVVK